MLKKAVHVGNHNKIYETRGKVGLEKLKCIKIFVD